jgi:serine/threonine protein kinase
MELADQSLKHCYEERISSGLIGIPGDDLMRYLRDAAEALDFMYEKHNLQHLDVKPANLLLTGDRCKVSDFSTIATFSFRSPPYVNPQTMQGFSNDLDETRLLRPTLHRNATLFTLTGAITPYYAPPEAFVGKFSPASDQFSLALTYCDLLCGLIPFSGTVENQIKQRLGGALRLDFLPECERSVLSQALSPDPKKRYPSCIDFIAALSRARLDNRPAKNRNGE